MNTLPGYVDINTAADLIGVHHSTVWRYIRDGRLDAVRVATIYLVKSKDVRKFRRPKMGRPRNDAVKCG